jgi:hypothetical protein
MDDPYGIWEHGVKKFPSYQKDFDKAMGFTVNEGFQDQEDFDDQPSFSKEFHRNEDERISRTMSGEQDFLEDDMFQQRVKGRPQRAGNIFSSGKNNIKQNIFGDNTNLPKKSKGKKGFFSGF